MCLEGRFRWARASAFVRQEQMAAAPGKNDHPPNVCAPSQRGHTYKPAHLLSQQPAWLASPHWLHFGTAALQACGEHCHHLSCSYGSLQKRKGSFALTYCSQVRQMPRPGHTSVEPLKGPSNHEAVCWPATEHTPTGQAACRGCVFVCLHACLHTFFSPGTLPRRFLVTSCPPALAGLFKPPWHLPAELTAGWFHCHARELARWERTGLPPHHLLTQQPKGALLALGLRLEAGRKDKGKASPPPAWKDGGHSDEGDIASCTALRPRPGQWQRKRHAFQTKCL